MPMKIDPAELLLPFSHGEGHVFDHVLKKAAL